MRQITDKSIYLWVLKWLPVIGTALIASHYAMLPFGYKSFIIDYITGVEPLLCVIAAIVLAYASEWASLCLSPPINFMTHYGKESKTSATEAAGDGSWQIQASAEIRRVSELLMATNGRRAKSSNTTV